MLAKSILLALVILAVYAFYRGVIRIMAIFKNKGCTCSKTGGSVCHCHDEDDNTNAKGF